MKTAIEILRVTKPMQKYKAANCELQSFNVRKDKDNVGREHARVTSGVISSPPLGTGRIHTVTCRLYPPQGKCPTWITCTCENLLFWDEVALTIKGSSSILHSNGKLPHITNPKLLPMACKHVTAVLWKSLQDGRVRRIITALMQKEKTASKAKVKPNKGESFSSDMEYTNSLLESYIWWYYRNAMLNSREGDTEQDIYNSLGDNDGQETL